MQPSRKLALISRVSRRSSRQTQKSRLEYGTLEPRQLMAGVVINEFLASNDSGLVDGNGNESDWIELYNAGDQIENLTGWHLTDNQAELGKWTFSFGPNAVLLPGQYVVVFASGDGIEDPAGNLHTNFSLSADGEYLALVRDDLTIASEFSANGLDYPEQFTDVSYGNGASGEAFFETPTPGAANGAEFAGVVGDTSFSVDRGYFTSAFDVAITTETAGATIYYTTDGSVPSPTNGTAYSSPINISSTTNLRAAAFLAGYIPTNVDTQTYIFGADVLTQSANPSGFPGGEDYAIDPQIANDALYTDRLLEGLQDIPTLSLTSDLDNIFGPNGVYTNSRDDTLEAPISAEYILADGTTGFQIDAGLKVAGGSSRLPTSSPKHSLSLRFRQEYGAGRLNYDLFEDSPVDSFNSLQLRALYNNSWIHRDDAQRNRGTLIRDQFIRDSLIALGNDDAGRGSYTNLFINGLFWGVYNLHERADSAHYAEYNGGDADDYDARNGDTVVDGNENSWNALQTAAASGTWQEVQDRLDVDNLIDWTLIQEYAGTTDVASHNNWRSAGGGSGDGKWRIYSWDSERTLEDVTDRLPGTSLPDVTGLYDDLMNRFPEFRQRLEDRIQLHYFNGGALTEEAVAERWQARVDELDLAVIGETARWGDYRRDVTNTAGAELYTRDVQWVAENERLLTEFFPDRGELVIDQYQSLGYFSTIEAPSYQVDGVTQSGGLVSSGAELTFSAADTVYYTVDGSDPRSPSGGISSNAIAFDTSTSTVTTTVFGENSSWRYNDTGANLGTEWRASSFNDTGPGWTEDIGDFGFGDTDVDIDTIISDNNQITNYFRKTFDYTPGNYDSATFSFKRDDGIVIYLNGVELDRDNLPLGTIFFDTEASSAIPNNQEDVFHDIHFDIGLLQPGNNTFAVEIHQVSANSSDVRFDGKLELHEQVTGNPSNTVILNSSTNVQSRTFSGGEWSPLHNATFSIPVSQSDLRISELHFNPADPTAAEIAAGFSVNDDFEFLEIYNPDVAGTINLDGVQLSSGVTFEFGDVDLLPGERAVIVEDIDAFTARYGTDIRVLGQWSGGLSNSGEQVTLIDATMSEIQSVNYGDGDPWYSPTDGGGFSLVLEDPVNTPVEELGKYYSWRSSTVFGGTPGEAPVDRSGVVINEILAHTDAPQSDSIELFNTTDSAIDIGGWFLSDSSSNLGKYQIPAGTVIAAGGYLVFDESDFNVSASGFALSSAGDQVYLSQASAGVFTGLEDAAEFDATFNGDSVGRLPNGTGRLVRLASNSFGSINGTHALSDVIISEVNYHPEDPSAAALAIDSTLTDNDLEFIEISNTTGSAIDLTNYRLRGEADFDFVAGTTLAAGGSLAVISFDPNDPLNADRLDAFLVHYGLSSAENLAGGFTGGLSNSTGRVTLQQPDTPDLLLTPRVVVDEVVYDDLAPFADADGNGLSLNRNSALANGNFASSWDANSPTPGVSDLVVAAAPQVTNTVRDEGGVLARPDLLSTYSVTFDQDVNVSAGDLQVVNDTFGFVENISGVGFSYNATTRTATWNFSSLPDLDASFYSFELSSSITAAVSGAGLDGDADGIVGGSFAEEVYVAIPGDANLDGDVEFNEIDIFFGTNTGDGATVFSNLNSPGTFTWAQGDFNADGDVDETEQNIFTGVQSGDLAIFFENLGRNVRPGVFQPVTSQLVASVVSQPVASVAPALVTVAPIVSPVSVSSGFIGPIAPTPIAPAPIAPAPVALAPATASVEVAPVASAVLPSVAPVSELALSGVQANFGALDSDQLVSSSVANTQTVVSEASTLELQGAHELRDGIFSDDLDDVEYVVQVDAEEAGAFDFLD